MRLNLAMAYRTLGQAQIFSQEYSDAATSLENAAEQFQWALDRFSPERQPQYVGWTQAGLGSTRRLQSYLEVVDEFNARNAQDHAAEIASRASAIDFLQQAITSFNICLAQDKATVGSQIFNHNVLQCACVPYAREARDALATLVAETPAITTTQAGAQTNSPSQTPDAVTGEIGGQP